MSFKFLLVVVALHGSQRRERAAALGHGPGRHDRRSPHIRAIVAVIDFTSSL